MKLVIETSGAACSAEAGEKGLGELLGGRGGFGIWNKGGKTEWLRSACITQFSNQDA